MFAEYKIIPANNGWILTRATYREKDFPPEATYVFNSAAAMAEWIKENLDKKEDTNGPPEKRT